MRIHKRADLARGSLLVTGMQSQHEAKTLAHTQAHMHTKVRHQARKIALCLSTPAQMLAVCGRSPLACFCS